MTYDLIIVGGGPAGVSAGIYAARKKLQTLLVTPDFGGQSSVSDSIENWIGTISISGANLAKSLEEHLRAYAKDSVTILPEKALKVTKESDLFTVQTETGSHQSKTVLITTGSYRRKLDTPGAETFDNKGISYCASCDGPLFTDQDVVVVGGGNAAFESAAQLLAYCKSVTLINRSDKLRADEVTVEKLKAHPKFRLVLNAVPKEVRGETFVSSLVYTDTSTQTDVTLSCAGIFVEIGLLPNTDMVKDLVALNQYNQIPVDARNQKTALEGLWAAGDCTDALYHQNNIASGDAVKALEDIYLHLHMK